MKMIALAGNPNSGKTTLFNWLTGSNQSVGNWPGVTVEKKQGILRNYKQFVVQDLPGIYSLSPYTAEEVVSRKYLVEQAPDTVVDIVDATNIERNLYLTLQLMETGRPLIVALNMIDLLKKQQRKVNLKKLSYLLGVPVIGISALKKKNLSQLEETMIAETKKQTSYPFPKYDDRLESALTMISQQLIGIVPEEKARWYAIKLFERDEQVEQELNLAVERQSEIEQTIVTAEKLFQDTSDSIVVNARYDLISQYVRMCVIDENDFVTSMSDQVDRVITNRWLALPIFFFVMWLVYYLSIQTIGTIGTDWVNDVLFGKVIPDTVQGWLSHWQVAAWMQGLIINGIINGLGSVLGFVPQIMMLFLCLGILEDCGYMSRIAFVMDRIFHRFNLSGKSFIPMLISTGCGVPGIMATRTIENEKDRKMTIMLTTFMPCSAKLTVIALISGTFFPQQSWVAPSAYFLGMLAVVGSGIFLKKTRLFAGPPQPFVMELPAYHFPKAGNVLRQVANRAASFVKKAGTIIFASCVLIWFFSSFTFTLQMTDQNHSMLRYIGAAIAPVFAPLGFGDWHTTVAVIAGLIAKENCVGTLRITFGSPTATSFAATLRQAYSPVAGYSFLAFNLLCAPCFAAIGTMYKEFGDTKWTLRAVGYQTALAYLTAMLIYQASQMLTTGSLVSVALTGAVILVMVYGLFFKRDASDDLYQVKNEIREEVLK
ncbi:MAG: ferrous iron transport protein B [Liquorilactobacillus nagelii]|jgi:ferrous iron transport protein B|uniref:Ferrous iron transport protein B n=1 Tax=Liquorilactobacillus nagelii TaxID=82688 RepID=A0A3S6QWB1_9LACO|nr:ferrous iron transport protein B [Liquorilactobacillus nagelii]AUJ32476.1 ferrous iron transport protein B [Liquorilactobacillus nagelii]KRL39950.1 ferrous iron transport protein B [Liquorilactobacillus nagelii DSM 13675]MCC7615666.1 ferrous iron transport protein B [Liquorilactobacillus nagelii]MCI1699956.1 ferrous iron transport protein B [Liquorilactobacillus nagelii]MCP9314462.1 ferrous iron transport protein B [Liquorilactobacillus nagelii]